MWSVRVLVSRSSSHYIRLRSKERSWKMKFSVTSLASTRTEKLVKMLMRRQPALSDDEARHYIAGAISDYPTAADWEVVESADEDFCNNPPSYLE